MTFGAPSDEERRHMSLRDDLVGVLARDPRYTIQAYAFILEALDYTKRIRKRTRAQAQTQAENASQAQSAVQSPARRRARKGRPDYSQHVNGTELCRGARELALRQFGLLAITVLAQWGINSTSDIGEIVFNLIASGDLEKTPTDQRSDFDDVFLFENAFRREFVLVLDESA
jgi:uncharacterized repeat protein (TIGR04138 family)